MSVNVRGMASYLCECVRIRDGNVTVEPVGGDGMKLSRDQAARRDVAQHIIDASRIVIVDETKNLVKDLEGNVVKGGVSERLGGCGWR